MTRRPALAIDETTKRAVADASNPLASAWVSANSSFRTSTGSLKVPFSSPMPDITKVMLETTASSSSNEL